jgi:hypothetical protein
MVRSSCALSSANRQGDQNEAFPPVFLRNAIGFELNDGQGEGKSRLGTTGSGDKAPQGREAAAGEVGLPVGSRIGRSKEKKEWYVLPNFLKAAIPYRMIELPIVARNSTPLDEPDLVASRGITADACALERFRLQPPATPRP